jgi:hypothetical protein
LGVLCKDVYEFERLLSYLKSGLKLI